VLDTESYVRWADSSKTLLTLRRVFHYPPIKYGPVLDRNTPE